jgi:hypothetical protein
MLRRQVNMTGATCITIVLGVIIMVALQMCARPYTK